VREEEALSAGGGIALAGRRPTLEIGGKQRRERVKEKIGGLQSAGLGLGLWGCDCATEGGNNFCPFYTVNITPSL
jgi:hypothetical protein